MTKRNLKHDMRFQKSQETPHNAYILKMQHFSPTLTKPKQGHTFGHLVKYRYIRSENH